MVTNIGLKLRMMISGSMLFGIYALFAAYIFIQFGTNTNVLIAVIVGSIIFILFQYRFGLWSALRSVGAEEMPENARYKNIHNVTERLSEDMGIKKPKLMITDMGVPNAFAVGRKGNGVVVLSTEIIDLLDEDELEGVIAHELAHIKNRDVIIMVIGQSIASIIAIAVQWIYIIATRGRGSTISRMFFSSIIGTIAQIFVMIFVMAISRSREYVADETASKYTGNPEAMASALEKISGGPTKMNDKISQRSDTPSPLFISEIKTSKLQDLLSTHPPIEKRIERLRS